LAADEFRCIVNTEDGNFFFAEGFSGLLELNKELKCLIVQFYEGEAYEVGKTVNE
jgi:hypothetical protein